MTTQDSLDSSQIANQHWAFQYVGKPWVSGGQGPDEFDCWGFFRHIQKEHFGIEVPVFAVDANDFRKVAQTIGSEGERRNWKLTANPENGCAVLMAHSKYPSHVGVWLDVDGGGVLHCVRGEGVVFSSRSSLSVCGWNRVEFYEYASNA